MAVLTAAAVLCGLLAPVTAAAAPMATDVPAATETEKVKAVNEIEVGEATKEWRDANDMDFVFKVYDRIKPEDFPLTREESYRVYRIMVQTPAAPDATVFIRTGIFDFAQRDRVERQRRRDAWAETVRLRREVAIDAEIPVDDEMVTGTDHNFVFRVYQRAPAGTKVKAGALEAFGGDAGVWKDFIENKLRLLHAQDQNDYIERERQKGEEAGRLAEAIAAKKDACHRIPLVAKPEWLTLTDDNFIRELLKTPELADRAHLEIKNAAVAALAGTSADWTTFIKTGVAEARARDDARILREREEADRQLVRDIRTKAETSRLRPRLAEAAAIVAANGTWEEVKAFLSTGQYVPLEQALNGITHNTRGKYVYSTGGDASTSTGPFAPDRPATPIPAATWKIVPGLGDPNCFSLESSVKIGNYLRVAANLRVQLVGNDGSEAYKAAATWCAKPGLDGSANVSLESKAHPGRYLRQYWSELWAANGRANDQFDTGANFQTDATWKAIDPRPLSTTPIMFKYYNEDWWRNLLGSPIGPEEIQTGTTTPSRHRRFANGAAFSSARTTTVYNVLDPLFPKYSASFGRWVQPTTDSLFLPDGKGRCTTTETGVAIYWSPTTGAHMVYGAILGRWRTLDHERGWLGYPISDEKDVPGQPGMRRSEFQHGNIDHTPERGAWAYAVNR
jgi:hypothetical protein